MTSWRKIAVVGAGSTGTGIAQRIASAGYPVVLVDLSEELTDAALLGIHEELEEGVDRGVFTPEEVTRILGRIRPSDDLLDAGDCDLVIEAVPDDLEVKAELLGRLGKVVSSEAVIATTSSAGTVLDLAESVRIPRRFLGLHFFHHPARNRLVEIIPGKLTSKQVLGDVWRHMEAMGTIPIYCADQAGFAISRFLLAWLNEAVRLLEEDIAGIATIEAAAREEFGVRMGPFELMNVLHPQRVLQATARLGEELGALYRPAARLTQQAERGHPWNLEGEVDAGRVPEVTARLQDVAFLVASELVDQGVCTREDLDIGVRVGLRWNRGPFQRMNQTGPRRAHDRVRELAARWEREVPRPLAVKAKDDMPFPLKYVSLRISGSVATVRMNRPDTGNLLRPGVLRQLAACFDEAMARTEVTAIVLVGAGRSFCRGLDLQYLATCLEEDRPGDILTLVRSTADLFRRIASCPKTVIARVDGETLGAGCELALCTDLIVASERSSFGFPETSLGLYPCLGGTARLHQRVGGGLARFMIYTGLPLVAGDALEVGLVDEVVPAVELDGRVAALARNLTMATRSPRAYEWEELEEVFEARSVDQLLETGRRESRPLLVQGLACIRTAAPLALRQAEQCITCAEEEGEEAGLAMALDLLESALDTADIREGLRSVREGRPPTFSGS